MKCKRVHKNLIFFFEKELPFSEMQKVREHLGSCPECGHFAEEMRKTLRILDGDKVSDENPFFYTRIKARLENQATESPEKRPVLVRVLQPIAFSILLMFGVYGGIKLGQPHNSERTSNTLAGQQMIPYLNDMDAEPIEAFLME